MAHMQHGFHGDLMARRAHASHILLRQKSDAMRIMGEIQEAKKPLKVFQKAAKKHSKCPSGQRGGDLGWFHERQMVREFSAACFEMPLNVVDRFVKTEFGYHLIWVHERDE
ncbi:MAG: peptidylprolyl isomerase [Candidatus Thermoplasmatota archaeon]|nr:peptidylprolyl isomerase [Candidatus Thermoplasmatota archaeon]